MWVIFTHFFNNFCASYLNIFSNLSHAVQYDLLPLLTKQGEIAEQIKAICTGFINFAPFARDTLNKLNSINTLD